MPRSPHSWHLGVSRWRGCIASGSSDCGGVGGVGHADGHLDGSGDAVRGEYGLCDVGNGESLLGGGGQLLVFHPEAGTSAFCGGFAERRVIPTGVVGVVGARSGSGTGDGRVSLSGRSS